MHRYKRHKDDPDYNKQPCEKCGTGAKKTEHHIYPRRWNFKHELQDLAVWLCLDCHGELEVIISTHERQFDGKMPNWWYPHVVLDFITE